MDWYSSLPPFPRPCAIESHQFHQEGHCHAIINGVALVEGQDGKVCRYDLMGHHSITFKDRK